MCTMIVILVFGLIVILLLFVFGMVKLKPLPKEELDFFKLASEWEDFTACKLFKELMADFMERRNEFWIIMAQFVVIFAVITLLVILLLKNKISTEAALPLISGLGSLCIGKVITYAKNNATLESPRNKSKD